MPISAIMLPAGTGIRHNWQIMSALTPKMPPVAMLTGSTVRCLAVPESFLAMCGATIPTNPTGPQNAVTAPVITDAESRAAVLVFCGLAPESTANSSPKSMMSSPFALARAIVTPMTRAADMIMTPPMSFPVNVQSSDRHCCAILFPFPPNDDGRTPIDDHSCNHLRTSRAILALSTTSFSWPYIFNRSTELSPSTVFVTSKNSSEYKRNYDPKLVVKTQKSGQ